MNRKTGILTIGLLVAAIAYGLWQDLASNETAAGDVSQRDVSCLASSAGPTGHSEAMPCNDFVSKVV